ncbi:MAG: hypothetical protein PHU25_06025 [Deltaproteobacteria bacterium]|nr:hypothetical protein [Deltaproteobacteria bacterium]
MNEGKKTLLIVDDEARVAKALTRAMGRYFDEVLSAGTASIASSILAENKVTHVICDHWLGEGDPLGLDLVPEWRRSYPAIERAVIMTGLDEKTLIADSGIDAIVSKLTRSEELARVLDRK